MTGFPLDAFRDFCARLKIPSRDLGMTAMTPLFGTQERLLAEMQRGIEEGVRSFVVLKGGRQIGGTTVFDALSLYWLQSHPGMVGMFISDDDENRDFRRDVQLEMLDSLPTAYRFPTRINNRNILAWTSPNNSRLIYASAGKRAGSNLGRSRGINFAIMDEVASWMDQQAIVALQAAFSKRHPDRLYAAVSTARGFGPFKAMWDTATTAVSQRAIFLSWFQHGGYRIERTDRRLWERYGRLRPDADERLWMSIVKKRYHVTISPEQLAWWHWVLAEECLGDEAMRSQEFGVLPELCFVAFGDKFFSSGVVARLRAGLTTAPKPTGWRYVFGDHLEDTQAVSVDPADADLLVWEEAERGGAYLVAAHPAYSSSQDAPHFCAQVWRLWPDRMRQVAEYWAEDGEFHKFAWVLVHLAGHYSSVAGIPAYLIGEVGYTGQRVLGEIQRLERYGYGLGPDVRSQQFRNVAGNIRHYLYRKLDALRGSATAYWPRTTLDLRASFLNGLRDEIERRHLEIRSSALVDELAMLRRGEAGDRDMIAGGGDSSEERALTAAHAVECWLTTAMPELVSMVAPKEPPPEAPRHPSEAMLAAFFADRMRG